MQQANNRLALTLFQKAIDTSPSFNVTAAGNLAALRAQMKQ